MDGSRFDAWTRRRFGLVAGGLGASLLGMMQIEDAEGKKKCKDLRKKCSKKKKCCKKKNLVCGNVLDITDKKVCCRPVQGECTEANECCGDKVCDQIAGKNPAKTFCCGASERECSVTADCCEGFSCVDKKCVF